MQTPETQPAAAAEPTIAPAPVEMTDARATQLQAELARLKWSVESHGGARRLNERIKIRDVRRQLQDAGRSEA